MAGSHRAPAPTRRSRTPAVVLVAVLVVGAAIAGGYALSRSDDDPPDHPAAPRPTSTSSAPVTTPTSHPTVHSTPPPKATPTAKPLPRVRPSPPRRLVVPGVLDVGFDDVVAPRNGVFRAASTAEVARWGGRGVPGSPGTDTVYVIGKASADGAFARLGALHRGSRITLRTSTGVLSYTVQATTEAAAKGLTADASFKQRVVGRLQLVGIRYDAKGDRTGTILVVTARLTGARTTP